MEEPIGILGFGAEGKSTLKFLQNNGAKNVIIFDKKDGDDYLKDLSKCKTIIRSAGVYPLQKEILEAQSNGAKLTSQIEIFFDEVQKSADEHTTIIGVTGTLGKGSCVSMISHCLNELGIENAIGGNFGVPALDLLNKVISEEFPQTLSHKIGSSSIPNKNKKVIILELSSFQLMTLSISPHIAVVLQVTSEHLDWHTSTEQYRDAKANLVRFQKNDDYCIYNKESEGAAWIASQGCGIKKSFSAVGNSISIEGHTLNIEDCKITGAHQLQNAFAALLALQALNHAPDFLLNCINAIKTYEGLPYRLQNVGSRDNLTFFNDSYSTRPEATIAAVKAMSLPFMLILGGSEKNSDFTELAGELVKLPLLRGIALIGYTAERIEKELIKNNCKTATKIFADTEFADPFAAAFNWCCQNAEKNGAILLSPACASFGLFPNYKVRGEAFNRLASGE
ncbi:UDP-N-acetylmuramoylalanine--D-glutamate ligase [Fibrobacterales bacterium]|nr:UDP-N-acetylmuramoylalanine--D-glutamate ligase [Fibrobacterales bacterium]